MVRGAKLQLEMHHSRLLRGCWRFVEMFLFHGKLYRRHASKECGNRIIVRERKKTTLKVMTLRRRDRPKSRGARSL